MAAIFQQKGQQRAALTLYEKALKIELSILPTDHPTIGTTYNNIGQLYFQMNDHSKALDFFLKALSIMLSTLPGNHPDLANLHASIGTVYVIQNQTSKAVEHLLFAEKVMDQSTLPADHNAREDIYRTLIILSHETKTTDMSIRAHLKLIDLLKARTPPSQHEIALSSSNVGRLFLDHDNHQQAFEYQQAALDIVEKLPRTEQNKTLYLMIVDNVQHAKCFDVALEHYSRLLEEETDSRSQFAGKLHNNLGVVYDYMENNPLALKHYRDALVCYESSADTCKNQLAIIHYNIAVIFNNLADYDGARTNLFKALNIMRDDHYEFRRRCHYLLGEIYETLGEWMQARTHFHAAIELATRTSNHSQFIAKYTHRLEHVINRMQSETEYF